VILSVQHDAHNHLVALISTPPSGGFFKAHLLQSCNLWPWQLPFNLTWLFTKLFFMFSPDKSGPGHSSDGMVDTSGQRNHAHSPMSSISTHRPDQWDALSFDSNTYKLPKQ
jgi:hypothetical protein